MHGGANSRFATEVQTCLLPRCWRLFTEQLARGKKWLRHSAMQACKLHANNPQSTRPCSSTFQFSLMITKMCFEHISWQLHVMLRIERSGIDDVGPITMSHQPCGLRVFEHSLPGVCFPSHASIESEFPEQPAPPPPLGNAIKSRKGPTALVPNLPLRPKNACKAHVAHAWSLKCQLSP